MRLGRGKRSSEIRFKFLLFIKIALPLTLSFHFIFPSAVSVYGKKFPNSIKFRACFDIFCLCCRSLFILALLHATTRDTRLYAIAFFWIICRLTIFAFSHAQIRAFTLNFS